MSATVRSRSGEAIIAPLIHSHAGALEQIQPHALALNPEALARAMRTAQQLYGLDMITLGGDGSWLARAALMAAGVAPESALGAGGGEQLTELPEPAAVVGHPTFATLSEALVRLRVVIGEGAAIAVSLPDATRMSTLLGAGERVWAEALLIEAVQGIGRHEPDLLMLVRDDSSDLAQLEAVAGHFGLEVLRVGPASEVVEGQVWLDAANPAGWSENVESGVWMYTTTEELPPDTSPTAVKEGVDALRRAQAGDDGNGVPAP